MEQQVQLQTRPNGDLNNWSQPVQQQNPCHCPLQALANCSAQTLSGTSMWDDCALLQVSICDMANLVLTMACWPGTALVEKNALTHAKDLPIDAKPASLVKCNGSCAWVGLDMASWIWNVMFCRDSVIRLCLCCAIRETFLLFLSDIPCNLQLLICESGLLQRLAEAVDPP